MRCPIKEGLLSAALLCALVSTGQAQTTPSTVPNFVPITDQMMRAPKPEDWMMHRQNYLGWGYSPLEQINKSNVKGLQMVWARVMEPGINEATLILTVGTLAAAVEIELAATAATKLAPTSTAPTCTRT